MSGLDLEVRIDDERVQVESCTVSRSVRRSVSVATLALHRAPEPGAEVVIAADGISLLTGWVVSLDENLADGACDVQVLSRTCLLAHRSLGTTARWRGVSVGEIVRQVCTWAGASMVSQAPDGPGINLDASPERSCWDVIAEALRGQGIAATDDGEGRLVLLRPDYSAPTALDRAGCTSLRRRVDLTARRSRYTLGRWTWLDEPVESSVSDLWMSGLGWDLTIRAPGRVSKADAQELLRAEALRRAGESITWEARIPGWVLGGRIPWPGDWFDLEDERLWLLDLSLETGPGGWSSTLTLGYPEACGFRPKPKGQPAKKGRPKLLEVGW